MRYHEEEDQDALNEFWGSAKSEQFSLYEVAVDEPLHQGMKVFEPAVGPCTDFETTKNDGRSYCLWVRTRDSDSSDWGPWRRAS